MTRKKIANEQEPTGFMVGDGKGGLRPASANQPLKTAREVASKRMAKGTNMNSPNEVRESRILTGREGEY